MTTPEPLPECDMTCTEDGFFEYEPCSAYYCHCSVGHPYLEVSKQVVVLKIKQILGPIFFSCFADVW